MKKIISNILRFMLFLGLGIFFIWLSIRGLSAEDFAEIKSNALNVNTVKGWFFLGLSILFGAAAHFVRSLRGRLLLEPLNYNIRISTAFYAVMVGYLANLAVPRFGEILRCSFLQRYEKVPFQKSLGAVVTERIIDTLCWLLLLLIVILLNTSLLSQVEVDTKKHILLGDWLSLKWYGLLHNYWLYIALLVGSLAIFLTRNLWKKVPFLHKIKTICIGAWQGLISIKNLKRPWYFLFYTIVLWIFYFLGVYLCFFAFDYLSPLGPAPAFTVLVLGTIAYIVAQGGLGAYPLLVASILALYNIDYNQALAAGWVGWSAQSAMVIIFGIISVILASLAVRKKSEIMDNPAAE